MKSNVEKCIVMHIGNIYEYTFGNSLSPVVDEKVLEVVISTDLKCTKQSLNAINKSNRMLGFIARSITYKTPR